MTQDLVVKKTTLLKQNTAQSSTLSNDNKGEIGPGTYAISLIEAAASNHYKVTFEVAIPTLDKTRQVKTWFFYDDGVSVELPKEISKPPVANTNGSITLGVKWDDQVNSRYPDQAHRMCFSSSIHMALSYISAKFKQRFPKDDDYLNYMLKYGDTTEAHAHIAALESLGFKVQYSQKGHLRDIVKSLEEGLPCALGILHRGTVNAPSGGGHWVCCGGVNAARDSFQLFDPYGSVLDDGGPYTGAIANGNGYWCPAKVLDGRWTVDSDSDGWMMTFRGN